MMAMMPRHRTVAEECSLTGKLLLQSACCCNSALESLSSGSGMRVRDFSEFSPCNIYKEENGRPEDGYQHSIHSQPKGSKSR